jgi:TonB family protein
MEPYAAGEGMNRPSALIYTLGVVLLGIIIFSRPSKNAESDTPSIVPLDYSKPVFTTSRTIVCPLSLFFDVRAGHSLDKVMEMFTSIWSRGEKAKALGCEELQADISATASSYDEDFALIKLPGTSTVGWFTTASDLTNKVHGQSDKEKKELAEPHISRVPDTSVGPSGDSSTLGDILVSTSSSVPILKGTGMAGTDSRGFGALICPDENHLIAFEDYGVDASKGHERVDSWEELKQFGCSYVPPETPMVSNGANEHRSLAFVTAELPDGTRIRGVTFARMFVQNQLQREESKRDASAQQQPASPSVIDQNATLEATTNQIDSSGENAGGPFRPGKNGVGYPSCSYCPDPRYSEEARAAKINGTVTLQIVIEPDGHATDVQVVKSLGHGLDELAIETVQNWRFKAALGPRGMPVPTSVRVEINFRLN